MPNKWFKKRAFWVWLLTIIFACLFIIPAYLFFTPDPKEETAETGAEPEAFSDHIIKSQVLVEDDFRKASKLAQKTDKNFSKTEQAGQLGNGINDSAQLSMLLGELLHEYRSSELTPDQKLEISAVLPDINQSIEGRRLIAAFFFSAQDAELAAAMHDMILDADLKDPVLIGELIDRDTTEFNIEYKTRLIDLIADLNTIGQAHSQKIEDFLADMALHHDEGLRQAAVSQWAWYVKGHKGILPVMDAYLFNHASQVRNEIYEIIELNSIQDESEKREVALALETLEYADYLSLSTSEKARIAALKTRLRL